MLGKFIREVILLCLPIFGVLFIYIYANREYFPAPRYTSNISLNMKLEEGLLNRGELDVISMGSSMNLNNLSTRAVNEKWPDYQHYNFGFWGCEVKTVKELLPTLLERKKPHTVVLTNSVMDMRAEGGGIPIDTADIIHSMDHMSPFKRYMHYWDAPYYLRQMESNKIRFNDANNYEYMKLDKDGGASLNVTIERRDQSRYDHPVPDKEDLGTEQYKALEEIGQMLKEKGVKLIVLHAPFRRAVMDKPSQARIAEHTMRVKEILEPMGHVVLDGTDRDWDDELFGDSHHFNEDGAYAFTQYCLAKL